MADWKEYKLGDVITFQRGHDLPKTQMINGEFPVAGSNGIIGYHNNFTTKAPGVTIGRSGNIGTPHFYLSDFWAHNTVLYIKDFKGSEPKFIYYFLKKFDFSQFNAGSAVPTLNRNHIHEIEILLPPLAEQQAIAEVLASLDAKIDLLHRQNKTLEAMAETLFRQWFVEEAAESWESGKLGDFVNIAYGKNLPTKNLQNEGYPVFGANGQIGFYEKYHYESPQILVSCRGEASGKVNISLPFSFVTNNSLILERKPNTFITFEFLKYFALKTDFKTYVTGSAQPQITIESLYEAEFKTPCNEKVKEFTSIVKVWEEKRSNNLNQIRTLANLRDALLPKLMSGETVRVKMTDAETAIVNQ